MLTMLLQRSKLAAQHAERPYLAPTWLLLLLGGLVVFALVMIYPQQNLIQRLAQAPESELSSAYMTNLLRTVPDDPILRLRLATQAMEQGNLATLRETLRPALETDNPAVRREALWLLWRAGAMEFKQLKMQDSAKLKAVREQLLGQLTELAKEEWSTEQQIAIAEQAFEFGDTTLGLALYRTVAERSPNPEEAASWYAKGARTALAQQLYRDSAKLYLEARQKTADPEQAKAYYLSALRTLQSGNLLAEALTMAEREIGPLANDRDTLLFLTGLARAAGRPDVADRYVRKLLRLSLLRQLEDVRLADAHGGAWGQKVSLRTGAGPSGQSGPFDDKVYTLSYQVFLENGKQEDAWKVAASAVRQSPDDLVWRERLAKVSEWTNRPEIALEHWLHLARQTQRADAWQSVLRLAPGLLNDDALIAALQYQLAKQPDDLRLLQELVAAWERKGEPRLALDYLARYNSRTARPQALEMMADLADRAGEPRLALQTWERLFSNATEATPARAIRAATLALLQGSNKDALRWLELAQNKNSTREDERSELLRMTGHLAEMEQHVPLAIRAYTNLSQSPLVNASDFDALIRLLEEKYPLEAARVAVGAWERFKQPRHMIRALYLYDANQQWPNIGALLEKLSPNAQAPDSALKALRRQPDFLRLSAAFHRNAGRLAEARGDITAALALNPASMDLQTTMLWLLIDSHDAPELRRFLSRHEPLWRHVPEMHDGLAAAYLSLSRPKVALDRYLTPHLGEHKQDFLWLMNYADALDQNQQSDRAWRLRRHLLSEEWQSQRAAAANDGKNPTSLRKVWLSSPGLDQARRLARTRLLMTQRGGDTGLDALRELLRLDRDAEKKYSSAAMEIAIGWLQDAGEYSAERAFLWQQYAASRGKRANQALWAEISVALATNDTAALRPLLERHEESLPRYDRINAASRLGDLRLAQTDAFETQNDQSDDDPLHMQLVESLLEFSDHAGFTLADRKLGAIGEQMTAGRWHLFLSPVLGLDVEAGSLKRSDKDEAVIRNVPDERFSCLRINWRHDNGQTALLAEKRHSLSDYAPLKIEHEQRIDDRLSLRTEIGQHLVSQESTALRVAGMKDRLAFSLSYQPTRPDRITFEQIFENYAVQTGSPVGRGTHSSINVSHALRQESRDLEIGAFWSTHRFSREASFTDPALAPLLPTGVASVSELQPSFFLPDNFDFYGIRLSTDMRYERQYTRGLRPYASIASTWHSQLGSGYDLRLGLAGSILGADHFSLTWGQGKAGVQAGGQTRELTFTYRIHF
jgi:hypothetical protein